MLLTDSLCDLTEVLYSCRAEIDCVSFSEAVSAEVSKYDAYWQNLKNPPNNCWGYYTQTITLPRCILWMDQYGFGADFDESCRRWLQAYTDCFEEVPFGQEIHPITGRPTFCSPWAFGIMSFYRYVVNRLGLFETKN